MSRAKRIMVQGTMSGAGKSLLCAALCRIFAQDGYRVAPFKSQNMALNSYVTRDGLEMGRAQVVQAQAAEAEPDVRMNPILLKPSSDTGSQVIVMGEIRGQMSAAEYFRYKKQLFPEVLAAFDSLAAENDIIVIEGAGSPAEINLRSGDIVNMGLALRVNAPVLLAGDIDRGGVFAQLYGTVALLQPEEQAQIAGLVINKFRGDLDILRPGLSMLEERAGKPVLGVVPYLKVDLDDEDSLAPCLTQESSHKPLDAAVVRLPRISNFTDFTPLEDHPQIGVRYVDDPRKLGGRRPKAGRVRHAGAGRVRRISDAGVRHPRPAGGGAWHAGERAGAGPAAHRDHLPPGKIPHTGTGHRDGGTAGRGQAGRLRDPHGPHRGEGPPLLRPGQRPARRLRAGRCVGHLSPRPV